MPFSSPWLLAMAAASASFFLRRLGGSPVLHRVHLGQQTVLPAAALDLFTFLQRLEHRGALGGSRLRALVGLLRETRLGGQGEHQRNDSDIHFSYLQSPSGHSV
ncbi:MAG: hypothetical protein E6H49_17660 [Betaproteobacteria bacterium]|nr:MAG: hypothetical protein E6H49_17660 [Betaproteobacteria bacterium]